MRTNASCPPFFIFIVMINMFNVSFLSALIPAGIALGTSLLGHKNQKSQNKQVADLNYQTGEMAAENAYQRQLDFWNMQNSYNNPNQMRQRLQDANMSVGLAYSGGAAGASNAGQLSSVPQNQSAGTLSPVNTSDVLRSGLSAATAYSQIKVNESIANRNNAEANVVAPTRADLNTSQSAVNNVLVDNVKARTVGQELTNSLQSATMDTNIQQATQNLENSEALFEQYLLNIDKTYTENAFAKDTFNARAQIIETDVKLKVTEMLVNYARVRSLDAGTALTTAQEEEIRAYLQQFLDTGVPRNGGLWQSIFGVGSKLYQEGKDAVNNFSPVQNTPSDPPPTNSGTAPVVSNQPIVTKKGNTWRTW